MIDPDTPVSQVVMPSTGLGDNILCMLAVKGLKARRTTPVVYRCHEYSLPWVSLFDVCDLVTSAAYEGVVAEDFCPFDSYKLEMQERSKKTRAEYYAAFCGNVTPVVPKLKAPLPPSPSPGCVCLVPYCNWHVRQWDMYHWLRLERLLLQLGYTVVILDASERRCGRFVSEVWEGQPAERVCSLVKEATALVAVDTGMAHVAAALGTRTVALCGGSKGAKVFGGYGPHVRPIEGRLPCSGCYWQDMVSPDCHQRCESLNLITPEMVLAEVTGTPQKRLELSLI